MIQSLKRPPSPALVIALIALFAALGGTAAALEGHNTVRSDDIVDGQVQGHDIKDNNVKVADLADGAVTPAKVDVADVASDATSVSTSSATAVDLGGPSVTRTVPAGALVEIYASAQISSVGGGADGTGRVDIFEPTLLTSSPSLLASQSNTLEQRYSAPGTGNQDGVTVQTRGGYITLSPPAGTYTFSLRYEENGGGTATYANRQLAVRVIR